MTKQHLPAATPTSLAARIAHLADWSWPDIKKEWHRLFGDDPPVANRRFVEKRIAYCWQEIEFAKTDRTLLERNQHRIDELVATGALKRQNVTFVPVTQQFNTTDAMGRMLLNILLTFAQFERELTAERIRDKFAASKKKGFWMHGICPLGYDVKDRRLVVNEKEAEQVQTIFRRFVELGSILKVVQEVRARGWRSKT